jgi:hypothetical protein
MIGIELRLQAFVIVFRCLSDLQFRHCALDGQDSSELTEQIKPDRGWVVAASNHRQHRLTTNNYCRARSRQHRPSDDLEWEHATSMDLSRHAYYVHLPGALVPRHILLPSSARVALWVLPAEPGI